MRVTFNEFKCIYRKVMIFMKNEEKVNRVLPLIFKRVDVPQTAKDKLRSRLFEKRELTYAEISIVAAAGDLDSQTELEKLK